LPRNRTKEAIGEKLLLPLGEFFSVERRHQRARKVVDERLLLHEIREKDLDRLPRAAGVAADVDDQGLRVEGPAHRIVHGGAEPSGTGWSGKAAAAVSPQSW